jgi:hypothetical protein
MRHGSLCVNRIELMVSDLGVSSPCTGLENSCSWVAGYERSSFEMCKQCMVWWFDIVSFFASRVGLAMDREVRYQD